MVESLVPKFTHRGEEAGGSCGPLWARMEGLGMLDSCFPPDSESVADSDDLASFILTPTLTLIQIPFLTLTLSLIWTPLSTILTENELSTPALI